MPVKHCGAAWLKSWRCQKYRNVPRRTQLIVDVELSGRENVHRSWWPSFPGCPPRSTDLVSSVLGAGYLGQAARPAAHVRMSDANAEVVDR
jgi:hypothetical protein